MRLGSAVIDTRTGVRGWLCGGGNTVALVRTTSGVSRIGTRHLRSVNRRERFEIEHAETELDRIYAKIKRR